MAWQISCGMIRSGLASLLVVLCAADCRGEPAVSALSAGESLKPLAASDVIPTFKHWWKEWAPEHLASHPLKAKLDELVAMGGRAKQVECEALANQVDERAPSGSPELLLGDAVKLRGSTGQCWWLHHDGLTGPGLGAALAADGTVLAVWIISEG
jgi:hypothetical protein